MALIKCPECGKENISNTAESCPNCGFKIKSYFQHIEYEKRHKKLEERRKQEIEKIPLPEKPKFNNIFVCYIVVAFVLISYISLYIPSSYNEEPNNFIWVAEIITFVVLPIYFYVQSYKRKMQEYEIAIKNPMEYKENKYKEYEQIRIHNVSTNTNGPKCPSCGSTNISNIGFSERAVSTGLWGINSGKIGKTHKCNNCGNMW